MNPIFLRLLVLVPLLLAGAASAQQPVGRVLLAAGDTFAVRNGQQVRLQYNSPIEFKDTLRTGAASSLQVRFNDESLLSLRENTDFAIEDYQFAAGDDTRERAFFRLLKGGFRSVTGLIGRSRNANYRVHTQTATIGIRGTDYAARMCAGDCGANVKDGLYGSVLGLSSGTNQITIENEGTPTPTTFGINQHFYVADVKTPPQPLLQPPTFVSIRPQGKAQAAQEGGSGTGGEQSASSSGAQAESRPSSLIEPMVTVPLLPYQVTELQNEQGTPAVLSPTLPPANGFIVAYPFDVNANVLFDNEHVPGTYNAQNHLISYGTSVGTFPFGSLGGGSIVDAGSLTLSNGEVIAWGRWTGSTTVTTSAGTTLSGVPLLFGTATGVSDIDIKTIGGVANYTYRGGPSPVDSAGNVGSVTSTSLVIDFTQSTASLSIGLNFPSISGFGPAVFSLSGPASPSSSMNTGEFAGSLAGSCVGSGCFSTSAGGGYLIGLSASGGFEFAAAGGSVHGTQAGAVSFLNAYTVGSYTPGPLPASLTGQIAWADPSFAPASTFSVSSSHSTFDAGNALTAFVNPSPCSTGTCTLSGTVSPGFISEQAGVGLVDGGNMNWGRWIGGQITDRISGTVTTYAPPTGVPFVVGTAGTTLPTAGSFTYAFAGGPNPVNTSGAIGTWSGGSFLVTFGTTQVIAISSPLTMVLNGATYTISGSSAVTGPALIQSIPLGGQCVNGPCATSATVLGNGTGIFVGPQAGGFAFAGNVNTTGPTTPTVSFAGGFKR